MMTQTLDVRTCVQQVRCRLRGRRGMTGKRFLHAAVLWLESDFLPSIHLWQASMFRVDGTVISFLSERSSTKSVQVFSAVVLGLNGSRTNKLAHGRIECLVLEVVLSTRRELYERAADVNNHTWMALETMLDCSRQEISLSVAIAPRKTRVASDEPEAAGGHASDRANIMLLAWGNGDTPPTVLGWAYHATDGPQSTTSMRGGQVYGTGHILWNHNFPLHDITNSAAITLAHKLRVAAPRLDTEHSVLVTPPNEVPRFLLSSKSDLHKSESDDDIDI